MLPREVIYSNEKGSKLRIFAYNLYIYLVSSQASPLQGHLHCMVLKDVTTGKGQGTVANHANTQQRHHKIVKSVYVCGGEGQVHRQMLI